MSQKSLWVDKYRPTKLEELSINKELSEKLKILAETDDFPHLLVHGPSGGGKKTRILCVLKKLFGDSVEKMKIDQRTIETASKRKLDVNLTSSNYHIELTPSDIGIHDRIIVQELLKEIGQTQQIDMSAKCRFKVVVINEADSLSRDAQAGLRRTMEKYTPNLRIILCCNSTSRIIEPIRSRCLLLRVPLPTIDEISTVLQNIAMKERIHLTRALADRIGKASERNLRKSILTFETMHMQQESLDDDSEIKLTDWEYVVNDISKLMINSQSPTTLQTVRNKFYELIGSCVLPSDILKKLAFSLLHNIKSSDVKYCIIKQAVFYDHRICIGSKSIFHLEAFAAEIMAEIARVNCQIDNV